MNSATCKMWRSSFVSYIASTFVKQSLKTSISYIVKHLIVNNKEYHSYHSKSSLSSGSLEKYQSTCWGVTPSTVAGCHDGLWSLSTNTATNVNNNMVTIRNIFITHYCLAVASFAPQHINKLNKIQNWCILGQNFAMFDTTCITWSFLRITFDYLTWNWSECKIKYQWSRWTQRSMSHKFWYCCHPLFITYT